MQSSPCGQSACVVHCGVAARHTLSTHTGIRASISAHWVEVVHVYTQNPDWQTWPVSHAVVPVQFGVDRVSRTQAPWSQ